MTTVGGTALLSSWSPDGTRIAYVNSCTGGLQVMNVSKSATGWVSSNHLKASTGGGCGASWSSTDPNKIAYADSQRIYVLDLSSQTRKGTSLGAGSMPGW